MDALMTSLWCHHDVIPALSNEKSIVITKTSKQMPNVIYQLQIKINRFFTVPIGCIKSMSTSSDKSAVSSERLWDITWNFQERCKTNFYTQKSQEMLWDNPFFWN